MHMFMYYGALSPLNQKANNGSLAEMYTAENFHICDMICINKYIKTTQMPRHKHVQTKYKVHTSFPLETKPKIYYTK